VDLFAGAAALFEMLPLQPEMLHHCKMALIAAASAGLEIAWTAEAVYNISELRCSSHLSDLFVLFYSQPLRQTVAEGAFKSLSKCVALADRYRNQDKPLPLLEVPTVNLCVMAIPLQQCSTILVFRFCFAKPGCFWGMAS